jgi:hypothetical protein
MPATISVNFATAAEVTGANPPTNKSISARILADVLGGGGVTGGYVTLAGAQTITGAKTFSTSIVANAGVAIADGQQLSIGGVGRVYGAAQDSYVNIRVCQNLSSTLADGIYINYGSTGTTNAHCRIYANGLTQRMIVRADSGRVGIGTETPSTFLHVAQNTAGDIPTGWGGGIHAFDIYANGTIAAGTNGAITAFMNSAGDATFNGNVAVGGNFSIGGTFSLSNNLTIRNGAPTIFFQDTDSRATAWHCNSGLMYLIRMAGNDSQTFEAVNGWWPFSVNIDTGDTGVGGNLQCRVNITAYASDERLKTNFTRISSPLEKIEKVGGYEFDWLKEKCDSVGFLPTTDHEHGLKAQEIQEIVPDAVAPAPFDFVLNEKGEKYSRSGENYLTVKYEKLVPLLIEAVKELSDKVKNLEEKLNS